MYTKEQVTSGIMAYVTREVIAKLPTSGKWIVGAMVQMMARNMDKVYSNGILSMLGAIDENGLIDVDMVCDSFKESANNYGSLCMDVPMVGTLTFSAHDIDRMREFIRGDRA